MIGHGIFNCPNIAIVNDWMDGVLDKKTERFHIQIAAVLLLAKAWMDDDVTQRRFIEQRNEWRQFVC